MRPRLATTAAASGESSASWLSGVASTSSSMGTGVGAPCAIAPCGAQRLDDGELRALARGRPGGSSVKVMGRPLGYAFGYLDMAHHAPCRL